MLPLLPQTISLKGLSISFPKCLSESFHSITTPLVQAGMLQHLPDFTYSIVNEQLPKREWIVAQHDENTGLFLPHSE